MISTCDFPRILHLKKRAFLAAYSRCGSLSAAAKRARVDRRSHYNWLADPIYQEAFQQAVQEAGDALEDKLHDLAHDGNVTAAIFLLKGLRPEKYRDQPLVTIDIGEFDGDFTKLSPKVLDGVIEEMQRRVAAKRAREGNTIAVAPPAASPAVKLSVQVVQPQSAPPSAEPKSQVASDPKPDQPFVSNYRGPLKWMR